MAPRFLALAALHVAAGLQVPPAAPAAEAQQLIGQRKASLCGSDFDVDADSSNEHANATLQECAPCWLQAPGAAKLFIQESTDGLGTRIHNMIVGMAIASKFGMNLGGVLSLPVACPFKIEHGLSHHLDIREGLKFFFGMKNSTEMFLRHTPPRTNRYENLEEFERLSDDVPLDGMDPRGPGSTSVILADDLAEQFRKLHGNRAGMSEYMTPAFLAALRKPDLPIFQRELFFKEGVPTVAVHIRRGDVCQNCIEHLRFTPDDWYLRHLDMIRQDLPDADIHIFSSLEGRHKSEEFNIFRAKNMTVHLDEHDGWNGTDIFDAWAHIARADIVLLARSSFGHVPALLNPKCVIYQEYWNPPLESWIMATSGQQRREAWNINVGKYNDCLRRIAKPEWGILGATHPATTEAPAAVAAQEASSGPTANVELSNPDNPKQQALVGS